MDATQRPTEPAEPGKQGEENENSKIAFDNKLHSPAKGTYYGENVYSVVSLVLSGKRC